MNDQASRIKILIVEDEILLAQDISLRLAVMKYEVVGIATSVKEALASIAAHKEIDLVLIDIVLKGDRDGIDLARIINKEYQIPFIFLTAHADQHIVARAKSVLPYAYILKPFNDRQVGIAIELAFLNFSKKTPEKNILKRQELSTNNQILHIKNSLFLKKDHFFKRVSLEQILFIQADSNYSTIYTTSEQFVYSIVLKKIEEQLPSDQFLRTHRSYIVNIQMINGFEGNMLFVGQKKIPVSKSHKEAVFKIFRTI